MFNGRQQYINKSKSYNRLMCLLCSRPAKQPIKPKATSASQRTSKRPRLHLSSPPPVTRLHPPPLGHFPDNGQRRTPTPPPPPPPLNLYCQSLPQREMLTSKEELAMRQAEFNISRHFLPGLYPSLFFLQTHGHLPACTARLNFVDHEIRTFKHFDIFYYVSGYTLH